MMVGESGTSSTERKYHYYRCVNTKKNHTCNAKQKIELQIIQEKMKHPPLSREDVTYWICRFRTLDVTQLEERRRLIDSFVNAVTIFDDYILITFNYKEGSERITFDEIKSSDLKSVGGPLTRFPASRSQRPSPGV